jgi:uncharacterized repeat protein (TIGR03803 family)
MKSPMNFEPQYVLVALLLMLSTGLPASAATEKILHSFSAFPHGNYPSGLVADSKGILYGAASGGIYNEGIVYRLVPDSNGNLTQTVLYNFTGGLDGGYPQGVVVDSADNLYGFASAGGSLGCGVFFKLTPAPHNAWTETVLYNFPTSNLPLSGGPAAVSNGKFFGQTYGWGEGGYGSIFELTQTAGGGWTQNLLYTFTGGADGGASFGPLAIDASGNLYGTADVGGSNEMGVVFKLSPNGASWSENVIHNFTGPDGADPEGGLIFDNAGNLYGTTGAGGSSTDCPSQGGCGTIFELTPKSGGGWSETVLFSFDNVFDLPVSPSSLFLDSVGNLFGTTYDGGADGACVYGCGMLFELSPNANGSWTEAVLNNFDPPLSGYNPTGGVVPGSSGRLYGTTSLGGLAGELNGTVFEATPQAKGGWKVTTPFAFPTTDGNFSQAALIEDGQGNLYGTTDNGGLYNIGTVFELSLSSGKWKERILYEFTGSTYAAVNGSFPSAALVMDAAGNLYGTAYGGGAKNLGAVFKLSPGVNGSWNETVLYSFTGGTDGENPMSTLIFDSEGNLYGTTEYGGPYKYGTVFKLSPGANGEWNESVLHSFAGYSADGGYPSAGLVFDGKGNLYGTTSIGGNSVNCLHGKKPEGCGTVFELSPARNGAWTETLLYSFTSTNGDGAFPYSNLIFDSGGNLYGTTSQGGVSGKCQYAQSSTCGTVFELTPGSAGAWTERVIHSFKGYKSDGANPAAGLVIDTQGNLYGTTYFGGDVLNTDYEFGPGTVFELSPASGGEWSETVLYNFQARMDGSLPASSLLLDGSGNLFGATEGSSYYGGSVVYEITP